MLSALRNYFYNLAASNLRRSSRYSPQLNDIPDPLYAYWKRSAQFEFKGIPQDAFFFATAAEGLMIFFDCVRNSSRPCALPSQAADSVWRGARCSCSWFPLRECQASRRCCVPAGTRCSTTLR